MNPDWQLLLAKMKTDFKKMQEYFEILREHYPTYAKQYKSFFDALIDVGFEKGQALEIIKSKGIFP